MTFYQSQTIFMFSHHDSLSNDLHVLLYVSHHDSLLNDLHVLLYISHHDLLSNDLHVFLHVSLHVSLSRHDSLSVMMSDHQLDLEFKSLIF